MTDPCTPRFWTVLRCSGKDTLQLDSWIRDSGVVSWTPSVESRKRLPRLRKVVYVRRPVIPSFVFVDVREEQRVHGLRSRCPIMFSRFRLNGEFPVIPDKALEPLREYCRLEAEKRRDLRNRSRPDPIPPKGTHVTCVGGFFDGLSGIVQGRKPGGAVVEFQEFSFRAVVPPFLFRLDQV